MDADRREWDCVSKAELSHLEVLLVKMLKMSTLALNAPLSSALKEPLRFPSQCSNSCVTDHFKSDLKACVGKKEPLFWTLEAYLIFKAIAKA